MTAAGERQVTGLQPVREALRVHGRAVRHLWLLRETPRLLGLVRLAEDNSVPVTFVARADLDRLSGGAMHQGAICSAPPLKIHRLADALEHSRRLVLTLDGIQDPQNFGAVVRSAVGLGKVPVVFGENSSAPLTPATFRASAGAVEHALLCRVPSLAQALLDGELAGFQVLGLDAHGDRDLRDCDLTLSTMLVLGGEGRGLSRGLKRHCSALVRLVSPDVIDSLNASVASAIALYEVLTQRARASNAPTFSA